MEELNSQSWNARYLNDNIPWDAGEVTRPIKSYVDQLKDKNLRILIPGAGNAHEAEYLHDNGFSEVFICDWAEKAIEAFLRRVPGFPEDHAIVSDFFDLEPAYDLIIEQTFFCALHPSQRNAYSEKVARLLSEEGKLAGVLFKELPIPQGPPFGGTKKEYLKLFGRHFKSLKIEECYNSIPPRMGNELFVIISGKKK